MGQLTWSAEDRYFRGLCVNNLQLETPADAITATQCDVCIYPFAGVPVRSCNEILTPDKNRDYILKTVAPFSVEVTYPELTSSDFTTTEVTRSMETWQNTNITDDTYPLVGERGYTTIPAPPKWIVDAQVFTTQPGGVSAPDTYKANYTPPRLWGQEMLVSNPKIPVISEYIVGPNQYGCSQYTLPSYVICTFGHDEQQPTRVAETYMASSVEKYTSWTLRGTYFTTDWRMQNRQHPTRIRCYDNLYTAAVLRIESRLDGGSCVTPEWSNPAARHRVWVVFLYEHVSWFGFKFPDDQARFQQPGAPYPTRAEIWRDLVLGDGTSGTPWNFHGERGPMHATLPHNSFGAPQFLISPAYLWESNDSAEFLATEDFVCDLVPHTDISPTGLQLPFGFSLNVAGSGSSLPKLEDPTGASFSTVYAEIRNVAYLSSLSKFQSWLEPFTIAHPYRWHADHLVTVPSSVVVSRVDVTGGS